MKVAEGVVTLELTVPLMGQATTICLTLVYDEETAILVDTGYPGLSPKIQATMNDAGVPFDRLNKIIITHQDIDHIGSLPVLLGSGDHTVEVLAHIEDAPYIQGDIPLIKYKPEQMAKSMAHLPEEQRNRIMAVFAAPPTAQVTTTLSDGEVLPHCGGITVIATPGHTPGHICLYLNQSKVLISGDALFGDNGHLQLAPLEYTYDSASAIQSLQKLTQYDIETVICFHGGICRNDVKERLAELAAG